MSPPKDFDLDLDSSREVPVAIPDATLILDDTNLDKPKIDNSVSGDPIRFSKRLTEQKYHPVVFIGSSGSGKTALLLSLLTYFKKDISADLAIFFGSDFFKPSDKEVESGAESFFNKTAAEFMEGVTGIATRTSPFFIPVRISGKDCPELKFAFLESEVENYQPYPSSKKYYRNFRPEIQDLLSQYPEGITFIWVAPLNSNQYADANTIDVDEQYRIANAALLGSLQNYEKLRSQNSLRDTHLFLVTKWDEYRSSFIEDINSALDRHNDANNRAELDSFLNRYYKSSLSTFLAFKTHTGTKNVFRFTAGAYRNRENIPVSATQEILNSYPRDLWNWLHNAMILGHDWECGGSSLIKIPKPPRITLKSIWETLTNWI